MAKVPLKEVAFNMPTAIPGCDVLMTTVVPMEERLVAGKPFICPQPYLTENSIEIAGREYPMTRVHFYTRATMAKSKHPEPREWAEFTVGKREPRRIKIAVEERLDVGPVNPKRPKD